MLLHLLSLRRYVLVEHMAQFILSKRQVCVKVTSRRIITLSGLLQHLNGVLTLLGCPESMVVWHCMAWPS